MTGNLKELRNVYTIEDMVQICVRGDVVTVGNAEYLRRNLGEFFGEINNALRESQYMYQELEKQADANYQRAKDAEAENDRLRAENERLATELRLLIDGYDRLYQLHGDLYLPTSDEARQGKPGIKRTTG